jgi:ABC-type nitrate/sulfonate/bicarbonate transport system substrate-binding protein
MLSMKHEHQSAFSTAATRRSCVGERNSLPNCLICRIMGKVGGKFVAYVTNYAALGAALCCVTGCGRKAAETVKIGYLQNTGSLPLFVAEEKGYFAEEGIREEATPIATSNQLVDALVAGNLQAFPESSAYPVLAVELQSPGRLKIFSASAITKERPFDSLLVKENSSVKKVSDLAGKRIGVFPGSTATSLLRKYLKDSNVDVSGITFVPIPPQTQVGALLEGSIEALHSYEPTTAIALARGGIRKLHGSVYAELVEPNLQGVGAVSARFLREQPETAKKVIRAFEKAMLFMRNNEAETRRIMGQRLKLEERVAQTVVLLDVQSHTELDRTALQKYADMLGSLGELKGHLSVDGLIYRE